MALYRHTPNYREQANRREVSIYECHPPKYDYTYNGGPYRVRPNEVDTSAFMSTIINGLRFNTHIVPVTPLTRPLSEEILSRQRIADEQQERNAAIARGNNAHFEPSRTGLGAFNSVLATSYYE